MSTPLTYFYKVKPTVLNLVSKSLLSEPQLPGPRHPPNTGSHCGAHLEARLLFSSPRALHPRGQPALPPQQSFASQPAVSYATLTILFMLFQLLCYYIALRSTQVSFLMAKIKSCVCCTCCTVLQRGRSPAEMETGLAWLKPNLSWLTFCLDDPSIAESGVSKASTLIVLVSISPFR